MGFEGIWTLEWTGGGGGTGKGRGSTLTPLGPVRLGRTVTCPRVVGVGIGPRRPSVTVVGAPCGPRPYPPGTLSHA